MPKPRVIARDSNNDIFLDPTQRWQTHHGSQCKATKAPKTVKTRMSAEIIKLKFIIFALNLPRQEKQEISS